MEKSEKKPKPKVKRCYCSVNLDDFKSRPFDHDDVLQIPGISDASLMGNDSTSEIQTSKMLLAGLGPKFERLLKDAIIRLNYPFEVVQAIHDFSLSGECNFKLINLQALLLAAKEFNIIGIKAQAGQYLAAATNIWNVLEMYNLSKDLCVHTRSKIKEFIL